MTKKLEEQVQLGFRSVLPKLKGNNDAKGKHLIAILSLSNCPVVIDPNGRGKEFCDTYGLPFPDGLLNEGGLALSYLQLEDWGKSFDEIFDSVEGAYGFPLTPYEDAKFGENFQYTPKRSEPLEPLFILIAGPELFLAIYEYGMVGIHHPDKHAFVRCD